MAHGQAPLPFAEPNMARPKVYAPRVRRRTATWPCRKAWYYDLTQWGGGYVRITNLAGAIRASHHKDGLLMNLATGEVYYDSRFVGG